MSDETRDLTLEAPVRCRQCGLQRARTSHTGSCILITRACFGSLAAWPCAVVRERATRGAGCGVAQWYFSRSVALLSAAYPKRDRMKDGDIDFGLIQNFNEARQQAITPAQKDAISGGNYYGAGNCVI